MLRLDAVTRQRRVERRERIIDISAGQHSGDFAKKLLKALEN